MNARRRLDVVRRHGFTAHRDIPAYRACPNGGNLARVVEKLSEIAESQGPGGVVGENVGV
jgi:hypothetical protein